MALSKRRSSASASATKVAPSRVSCTRRVVRSNSFRPTRCSNCWIVAVSEDWVVNSSAAAEVNEPWRATARKQRRCRSDKAVWTAMGFGSVGDRAMIFRGRRSIDRKTRLASIGPAA